LDEFNQSENVHKRIQLYCGDEYGVTVKSKINEGTCVSLKLCIKGEEL